MCLSSSSGTQNWLRSCYLPTCPPSLPHLGFWINLISWTTLFLIFQICSGCLQSREDDIALDFIWSMSVISWLWEQAVCFVFKFKVMFLCGEVPDSRSNFCSDFYSEQKPTVWLWAKINGCIPAAETLLPWDSSLGWGYHERHWSYKTGG